MWIKGTGRGLGSENKAKVKNGVGNESGARRTSQS